MMRNILLHIAVIRKHLLSKNCNINVFGIFRKTNGDIKTSPRELWILIIAFALVNLLFLSGAFGQSISVTNIATTPVCSGSSVTVTFSTTNGNGAPARFDNETTYTIYLSNSSGTDFTSQGIFNTTGVIYNTSNRGVTSGITVIFTIPSETTTGNGYKISLGSSNPTFNGSSGAGAPTQFAINAFPTASAGGSQTICPNGSATVSGASSSNGTILWTHNGVGSLTNATTLTPTYIASAGDAGNSVVLTMTVSNSPCAEATATYNITVRDNFTAGAIATTGETICYGGTPATTIGSTTVASGGDNSITYSWRSSADSYTAAISGATSATYLPPAGLTTTTSYRRYAKDVTCSTTPTVSAGTWTVTVRTQFTTGTIASTGETICNGGNPTVIGSTTAASGGSGTIAYKWQANGVDIFGATGSSYDPPSGLTANTTYTRWAKDGLCNTIFTQSTGSWVVTVNGNFTAGAIGTSGQTICYNGDPGLIGSTEPAAGGDGAIVYQWQSSTDNFATAPTNISNDSPTYNPPANLTETTWYRRQAKDGTCNTGWNTSTGVWMVTVQNIDVVVTDVSVDQTDDCPDFINFNGETGPAYNPGLSEVKFRVERLTPTANWNFDFDVTGTNVFVATYSVAGDGTLPNPSAGTTNNGSISASASNSYLVFTLQVVNKPGQQLNVKFEVSNASANGCSETITSDNDATHIIKAMPEIGSFE